MTELQIDKIIEILSKETEKFEEPIVSQISKKKKPYHVLISCMLSLRTKDEVTAEASKRLFALADTPDDMVKLNLEKIEKAIYPVGFYKNKAKYILETSQRLIDQYEGQVPEDLDLLLKLKGVGRKTANLVVGEGFNKPAICVDTHVHRISNRFGYVSTKTPEKTEFALREKLPKKYWKIYNKLLVTWGQNICAPISPKCNQCAIKKYCSKIGVKKHR